MEKIELLAPVGSMESLYAAVNNGADAIYLGGPKFSARAKAIEFDNEKMKEAAKYIVGEHDFASFCSSGSQVESTVRTVYRLEVDKNDDVISIIISGNPILFNLLSICYCLCFNIHIISFNPLDCKTLYHGSHISSSPIFFLISCPKVIYKPLKMATELLAGIPSVVYGFFGLVVLVPWVREIGRTLHQGGERKQLRRNDRNLENIPVGALGLIALDGCTEMGAKVNDYLVKWRKEDGHVHKNDVAFTGYEKDTYLIDAKVPRFGSGEAKGIINESVRGKDLYLMVDVCNYSLTYSLTGNVNHMSPDDHFQNLKRIIAAVGGKGRRINVIMPFLYESRQHKRGSRESLDCALALQELVRMGVDNIITFDAHDPRVQNAIPLNGFETIRPTYQFIKGLLRTFKDLQIDSEHMMAISPDEGATGRAIYLANVLNLDDKVLKNRIHDKSVPVRDTYQQLKTAQKKKDEVVQYKLGDAVTHPKFGHGIVEKINQRSGGVHLHIRFNGEVKCIDQKWLSRKKYT